MRHRLADFQRAEIGCSASEAFGHRRQRNAAIDGGRPRLQSEVEVGRFV